MPKTPVLEGKQREPLLSRPIVLRLALAAAVLALPTWALATSAAPVPVTQPVAPAKAGAGAPAGASQPTNARPAPAQPAHAAAAAQPSEGLGVAYAHAVALQGAIVLRDWVEAARHLAALKSARTAEPTSRAQQQQLAAVTPLIDGLDMSIHARNARRANEQAYHLASTLMIAMNLGAESAGGGGGFTPPAVPTHPYAALQHLRLASDAAAQSQVRLLAHDTAGAKRELDQVRDHLHNAYMQTHSRALRGAIADLDRRRWRVVASLNNPPRAYAYGAVLSRGMLHTMRLVGRTIVVPPSTPQAPGGGGGGRPKPMMQDVPTPRHALNPHHRPDKQVSLETTPYGKRD